MNSIFCFGTCSKPKLVPSEDNGDKEAAKDTGVDQRLLFQCIEPGFRGCYHATFVSAKQKLMIAKNPYRSADSVIYSILLPWLYSTT
jgi:hypothetical protein